MRLFVAINLPSDVRDELYAASAPLRDALGRGVSWVSAGNLHVTVQFLGDVATARVDALAGGLRAAACQVEPFAMQVGGIGAFPAMARPRVLWMGAEPNATLRALYHAVTGATARFGFQEEDRPYHPHVTIGRARPGARLGGLGPLTPSIGWSAGVEVRAVDLMASELGPRAARYRRLASCLLGTTTLGD